MPALPTTPGFHQIDVVEHLQQLFEYDSEIFDIKPIAFPFDKPEELKKYLLDDHKTITYILNTDESKFAGYFAFEENLELPNMVELINLGVMPEYQRHGYGSKLMEKYLSFVGSRDSRHVTHPDSQSRFLYEKFGYNRVKIIKNYFGDGEPRVLYFRKGNQ